MNRKVLERVIRSTARTLGWQIKKTSSSRSSKYIYLEKRVTVVIRVSDHPSKSNDVVSIESTDGDFSSAWRDVRAGLIYLLQNPFTKVKTLRRRKRRFNNRPPRKA